jgi:branched-chain amino acid transport system substrate-binding protein
VEKAKNTAQRMVAQEPDLVGASGAWLSSFTLGVTEVTERADLPILTLSYSDQITARGFEYVFQTSLTGGFQANNAVPALLKLAEAATGRKPQTVGTPLRRWPLLSRCGKVGCRSWGSSSWSTKLSRLHCRTVHS